MFCFATDCERKWIAFSDTNKNAAINRSSEPPTFPPSDCANNALFASMGRHCGGLVYVHPFFGEGGIQCSRYALLQFMKFGLGCLRGCHLRRVRASATV